MGVIKKPKPYQLYTLRAVSGAAYLSLALEWLLLLAVTLPRLLESSLGKMIFPKSETHVVPTVPATSHPPSGVVLAVALVIGVALVVLALYLVVTRYIPNTSHAASAAVGVVAKKAVPIVAHKPIDDIPPKRRNLLTRRLRLWSSVVLASIPGVILVIANIQTQTLASLFVLGIVAVLALMSVAGSAAQAWFHARWQVEETDIR